MSGISATFANIFWGWFYDLRRFSRPTLAKACWFFFVVSMLGTFGWQVSNEKLYGDSNPKVTLDWENPGFGRGFASMVILRYVPLLFPASLCPIMLISTSFLNESHYMFVYWIVGAFFDDIETLTLAVGLVRTFESVGSSIAFGIGASSASPMVNLIIAFVMFGFTIPATSLVVFMVPERPVDLRKEETEEPTESENVVPSQISTKAVESSESSNA